MGVIARYGMPLEHELAGIRRLVGDATVCFLGGCDPFDLLVFAWLRSYLAIRYLGVSDAVVDALGIVADERMTIDLPKEEGHAMALLREMWPDYATAIGPHCADLVNSNRKLELEALASFKSKPIGALVGPVTATAQD